MKLFLIIVTIGSAVSQELYQSYNISSKESNGVGFCPSTKELREKIRQDVQSFISNSILPKLCDCGGPGWRRVVYLNMSDQTQTCPPAWELITSPRRTCARPSNASGRSCYSAMFPVEGIQYSEVCGRIVGYQKGQPEAFYAYSYNQRLTIDDSYVDGVSLTYGNPRQHIWTFANALNEQLRTCSYVAKCPCTNVNEQHTIIIPSYVGNDYFCETGVPPGQTYNFAFHAADPLWDGKGCGPTSTCCTFNNPPWFCKQLNQSTNVDLEVRLCSHDPAVYENTPVELIELYIK